MRFESTLITPSLHLLQAKWSKACLRARPLGAMCLKIDRSALFLRRGTLLVRLAQWTCTSVSSSRLRLAWRRRSSPSVVNFTTHHLRYHACAAASSSWRSIGLFAQFIGIGVCRVVFHEVLDLLWSDSGESGACFWLGLPLHLMQLCRLILTNF